MYTLGANLREWNARVLPSPLYRSHQYAVTPSPKSTKAQGPILPGRLLPVIPCFHALAVRGLSTVTYIAFFHLAILTSVVVSDRATSSRERSPPTRPHNGSRRCLRPRFRRCPFGKPRCFCPRPAMAGGRRAKLLYRHALSLPCPSARGACAAHNTPPPLTGR